MKLPVTMIVSLQTNLLYSKLFDNIISINIRSFDKEQLAPQITVGCTTIERDH